MIVGGDVTKIALEEVLARLGREDQEFSFRHMNFEVSLRNPNKWRH